MAENTASEGPPPVRERLAALRHVPALLKLAWRAHPRLFLTTVLLRLLRAVVPLAILWVGKLIIDSVVAVTQGDATRLPRLWRLLAVEVALAVAAEGVTRASALVERLLSDLFSNHTGLLVMSHASTLDVHHFEDPDFYDRMERAWRQTSGQLGLLVQTLALGQDALTVAGLAAAFFVYSPWLLLLLTTALLPGFLGETRFAAREYSLLRRRTPARRQLNYLLHVAAGGRAAKEVHLFGLSSWLAARYEGIANKLYEEEKRLAIRRSLVSFAAAVVAALGYYGAYLHIIWSAVAGAITLGTLTFLAASFSRSRDVIQRLLSSAGAIYSQGLYLKDLFDFFEARPSVTSPPGAPEAPRPFRDGFVFEGVGFRYPGSDRWALRNVSFSLRPGERVAFVGENGAGKTTLAKLLARLYDPTEGRILLDGRDLREYDLASLRRAVGVIFQDFQRYDMRLDENIGVGEIEAVQSYLNNPAGGDDRARGGGPPATAYGGPTVPARIVRAAEKSQVTHLLPKLPEGYRQMLGRRFEGGVELSGGEWQKIALARAYMRDSQVLILDEPTASLDARAEREVFTRFSELVQGRTAVIVSHRFSTVRMADRIIVLDSGTVAEEGSHEELLARRGLYAEFFRLQSEGYL